MEIFFEHLLKTSVVLVLFILAYHFFLKRETLFTENRLFLISGLLIAVLFPFVTLTKTVTIEPTSAVNSAVSVNATALQSVAADNTDAFNWGLFFLTIYIVGVLYFGIRLLLQLQTIQRVKLNSVIVPEDNFYHVRTPEKIAPFSFFRHIFYHPRQFEKSELQAILAHEKVHAKELHSLDILLTEIILVLQWFNPAIWLYRLAVKQNLEYLADAKTCKSFSNKKFYQYVMLKQAVGSHKIAIVNPFFNSLTKKRIVMMNKNQSKKRSLLKMLPVVPVLAGLLVAFNTKEVYIASSNGIKAVEQNEDARIEVIINSGTTDEELKKVKEDLKKEGVDLSYRTVRNDDKKIIALKIHLQGRSESGKTFNANFDVESEEPIDPVMLRVDTENGTASVGNHMGHNFTMKTGGNAMFWSGSDKSGKLKDIVITKENDREIIKVNGKVVSREELGEESKAEKIFVQMLDATDSINGNVIIHEIKVDEEDNREKIIKVKKIGSSDEDKYIYWKSDDGDNEKKGSGYSVKIIADSDEEVDITKKKGAFVLDTKNSENTLYFIDGKKATAKDAQKLSQNDIESINVWKGDKAIKKYGKKAKDGVVEITTKKEN
ncbi:M56 family metallopeptidase [Flagellimonas lutaonensis]|uniref:Peptidase M56 domain-containing protein n=1 Tax=Flagellimonas lutaonensis TaxID=516051 RepID=A0A0D5YPG2_9FLAO|nr:M56 family metallopeptidase [Allomuricauda lutaonensis]AKA34205.1 hypothetical protein VC82_527 [Allomuricauda lutaonensis]